MSHDVDLFVIGGGSGGVRAARVAAGFGARVALAESRDLGGTCVNLGCVPKKMLVYGASYADDFEHARHYGWSTAEPQFDWPSLLRNKNREIARLNQVYARLLADSAVRLIRQPARLIDAHTVEAGGERVRAAHILIATGGRPYVPDIPGSEYAITSDQAFHLPQMPRRIVVAGGGYIAVEFASIFHGLGAAVTQLYRGDLFLRGFDGGLRTHLREQLSLRGLDLRFKSAIKQIVRLDDGSLELSLSDHSKLQTDCLLFAKGRRPVVDDLGLANTRAALDTRGYIAVDEHCRTAEPSIFAVGDVIGRVQLTPVALAEGTAVARLLFRPDTVRPLDYSLIPTAVFSLPNIGTVGLSEEQAIERHHRIRIYESRFRPLKLTLTDSSENTFLKLVVDADSDRVLGAHMVGPDAGEIIQGLAVALKAGATKQVFDDTIGVHPTTAEEFVTMRTARVAV
ncbi:MAG: gor [Hydrocarboniphaga sp.]|uniref:glutathione-disulfide reductase n=1 Tax=Hydrocarboniphaga sp. TaxID=2033016 RepID=UPI002630C9DC|nr:glutathione-disulfide reductase [Hydrocarboniphaga sp.]MDB5971966.1 gor [Hydrocarboniphaga sp.]